MSAALVILAGFVGLFVVLPTVLAALMVVGITAVEVARERVSRRRMMSAVDELIGGRR